MRKILIFSLIAMMTLSLGVNLNAQNKTNSDVVLGKWMNADKDAKFEIYKEDGKYFAKIYWLKRPIDKKTGKPRTDEHNNDDELAKRPLMGLVFLNDFVWDGKKFWDDGEIYDPKTGKTYDSYMWIEDKDTLNVKGYIGLAIIGKTSTWTRVKS